MVTNFDYLKNESRFSDFAEVAISAEKIILIDPQASIINCRRAMEFAVKWMYSVDEELEMPYQDNLQSLMNNEDFRDIVGPDIWKRMDYIRRCGNNAAHSNKKLGKDIAMLCLENLFIYLDFVACCYSGNYEERTFDRSVLTERIEKAKESKKLADATKEQLVREQERTAQQELDLKKLIKENASLKEELSARRQEQQQTYVPKPLDLSEYKTRKLYIDVMLMDAGWIQGKDWMNEVELRGMPNKSEVGYADYVLYDDMHRPLALIEAKRTCVDVSKGRQQAKLYADLLEKQYGRRPVIFLTNGFETHIIDGAVMFYVAGTMKNPEVADTNTAETVTFGATIILGNNGNVGVARMIAPIGTVLTTPELIDILDGFKLTNSLNINNSSQVL